MSFLANALNGLLGGKVLNNYLYFFFHYLELISVSNRLV